MSRTSLTLSYIISRMDAHRRPAIKISRPSWKPRFTIILGIQKHFHITQGKFIDEVLALGYKLASKIIAGTC